MAESVPLRIGGVQRRGRFVVEEAVDSEGVAASHIYHTRVSYRDCCGDGSGSVCCDASVKSMSSVNTFDCGYTSSSSTASSVAIEPLRIRRVGRFLCDCFPEQAQLMPRKQVGRFEVQTLAPGCISRIEDGSAQTVVLRRWPRRSKTTPCVQVSPLVPVRSSSTA
ncbi:hypothetical protein Pmar_PMAR027999 [Perkinsus marinus ATCC 50983]|uniref:Uncharacterized protein n=1 Tax=Perkinsus marinus (strain ATCC 50983 / TXsc) TaxID=423536 RepID=C5LV98_PERM5|nr:hypothetical protein Pmar_PMAR027999 [Perkinsus marinus ATCC 50983]EEQ99336.1 hypothetical protein Pmar_PMAR027999 [Perkinsus marinus ATCC 50983]|eukprot:XP_002766619.1 hypothetical protein Pmar_PMAR027999 [Perkinsus marinus ATCC 50983]